MAATAAAVRPGGQFVFTVERGEEDYESMTAGFRINPLGRYSHQESYVRRIVAEAGMETIAVTHGALRQEMGSAVAGLVVTVEMRG
jgi:predicted TPR repeat methyltransferase